MADESQRRTASLAEAKAHFAECVRRAERGYPTVLTRHGRPVAQIAPLSDQPEEIREPAVEYESHQEPPSTDSAAKRRALLRLLENEIWPQIPQEMIGKGPTKREREEILGIRENGT